MIKIYNRDNLFYGYCHGYDNFNNANIIYSEIPTKDLIFYTSLSEDGLIESGQNLTKSGTITYQKIDNISCAYFNGNSYLLGNNIFEPGYKSLSICCWVKYVGIVNNYKSIYYIGNSSRSSSRCFGLYYYNNNGLDFSSADNELQNTGIISHNIWNCLCLIQNAELNISKVYLNGNEILSKSRSINLLTDRFTIGCQTALGDYSNCYISSIRGYNRVLTQEEIILLSKEFKI